MSTTQEILTYNHSPRSSVRLHSSSFQTGNQTCNAVNGSWKVALAGTFLLLQINISPHLPHPPAFHSPSALLHSSSNNTFSCLTAALPLRRSNGVHKLRHPATLDTCGMHDTPQ